MGLISPKSSMFNHFHRKCHSSPANSGVPHLWGPSFFRGPSCAGRPSCPMEPLTLEVNWWNEEPTPNSWICKENF